MPYEWLRGPMTRKLKGFKNFDVDAYKRRLRIMREILAGANQTEFAKLLGVDFKRWSNYERGYPLPREVAFLIDERFPGMSIEWLWYGRTTALSFEKFRAKIEIAEKLDVEQAKNLAEMEKLKQKLNASAERRKKALHPAAKKAANVN